MQSSRLDTLQRRVLVALDAPSKDSGFSALTLSWVLKQQSLQAMASASGLTEDDTRDLLAFRDELIRRLMDAARPDP